MKPLKQNALLVALLYAFATTAVAEVPKDPKERQAKAQAMFAERCKKAGVFIHRTVENVEGILLLKVRPRNTDLDFAKQFEMNDPYGKDYTEDDYIGSFLQEFHALNNCKGPACPTKPHGYRNVDAIDTKDGKRYRYTGRIEEPWQYDKSYLKGYLKFAMDRAPTSDPAPRYGVTYDDISTREERDYWIAGSSLRVIDLQTDEVIAERIGYMMDWAQGSRAGARRPWLLATNTSCPSFGTRHGSTAQAGQALKFVKQVLKPKLGH